MYMHMKYSMYEEAVFGRAHTLPVCADRPYHNVPLKKKDLCTGEVVRFSYRAQPYLVQPDPDDENCFFLSLGRPNQDGTALEVLRDEASGWIGFRSTTADDRFLQASKRRVAKMMFFNHNFGTNGKSPQLACIKPSHANSTRSLLSERYLDTVCRSVMVHVFVSGAHRRGLFGMVNPVVKSVHFLRVLSQGACIRIVWVACNSFCVDAEHWEILNPPHLPWTRTPCQFRHRRYQVCAQPVPVPCVSYWSQYFAGTITLSMHASISLCLS